MGWEESRCQREEENSMKQTVAGTLIIIPFPHKY